MSEMESKSRSFKPKKLQRRRRKGEQERARRRKVGEEKKAMDSLATLEIFGQKKTVRIKKFNLAITFLKTQLEIYHRL